MTAHLSERDSGNKAPDSAT